MKYLDRENIKVTKARHEQITTANMRELNDFMNNLQISELPDNFKNFVGNLDYRIAGIRLMSYDTFCDRFPARTMPDSFFAIPDGKNPKTGFPTLYVYCPELTHIVQKLEDKNKKVGNLKRIGAYFFKKYGIHLENNPTFSNFALNTLPADVPFNLIADGSRIRVAKLAETDGNTLYGDTENDIFAVSHTYKDTPTLTIFCKELDCVGEFATKLSKKLEISEELALQISQALPHDQYYSVFDIETNFEKYAMLMAKFLRLTPGDIAHDLLQGEVEVITAPYSKKVVLNLDDELPSAILVGNRLNLYVPGWGELGVD